MKVMENKKFCWEETVLKYLVVGIITLMFCGGVTTVFGQCSGTQLYTAQSDTFDDGSGYYSYYQNNLDCEFLISPPGAASISLDFSYMDLIGNDYVHIYDGDNINAPLLGSFDGSTIITPQTFTSTGGDMLVKFVTNSSYKDWGWEMMYTSTMPINIPCNGLTTLTTMIGMFDDGSGVNNDYPNNSYCEWLIQPAGASTVTVNFTYFDVENNYDYVYIYDGSSTSDPLLGTYTGTNLPLEITSTSSSVFIVFTSDYMIGSEGFEITYNGTISQVGTNPGPITNMGLCNSLTTYGMPAMTFHDGSGVNVNYVNNSHCFWLIQPTIPADTIELWMVSLMTEYGYDYVKVYDGTTINDPQIAYWTGSVIWSKAIATSGAALVEFVADDMINDKGWEIYYETGTIGQIVGISENSEKDIEIYPNPNNGEFNIMSDKEAEVKITDMMGRTIYKEHLNKGKNKIDLSNEPSGYYNITVVEGNNNITKRININ